MRGSAIVSVLLSVMGLAGCSASRQAEPVEIARPRGIDGSWSSAAGAVAYNANFAGGRFTSTEAGTGAILAEGTYRTLGPGQITIDYTSRIRGTRVAANCNQVAPDRLACASSSGNRFEFVRRA